MELIAFGPNIWLWKVNISKNLLKNLIFTIRIPTSHFPKFSEGTFDSVNNVITTISTNILISRTWFHMLGHLLDL